ncbi:hypothetical protein LBMAG46_36600 [Planctomycetia bacterium]|jgi:hypothetical protein|nr:hypothetical protein LBMAG46_36600 [Planctomycetia bacterium]
MFDLGMIRSEFQRRIKRIVSEYDSTLLSVASQTLPVHDAAERLEAAINGLCRSVGVSTETVAAVVIAQLIGQNVAESIGKDIRYKRRIEDLEGSFRPHGIPGNVGLRLVAGSLVQLTGAHPDSRGIVMAGKRVDEYICKVENINDDNVIEYQRELKFR